MRIPITLLSVIPVSLTGKKYPLADERKRRYFPFLEANKVPVYKKDLKYSYKKANMELLLDLISSKYNGIYRCMFIGEEKDKFHFALYFRK